MAASIHKRASARRDLTEHYVYLAGNAGIEIAERFLVNAEKRFGDLARHPGMGVGAAGLRNWQVRGFEKIFYLPREGGVSIVRVLNAAQDWWGLLGML